MKFKFHIDKIWIGLFVVVVAFRLAVYAGVMLDPGRAMTPDSGDYIHLASTISRYGAFGEPAAPESFRVPGYPAFLAGLHELSESPRFISLAQVILSLATCVLVWNLARRLMGRKSGYVALLVQGFSIVSAVYACRILSEALFVFIFALFLNLFLLTPDTPSGFRDWARIIGAGVVLAAAAYVRAVALPIGIICVAFWVIQGRPSQAIAFGMVWALLLAPWYIRNAVRTGEPPHFSTVSAYNMYRYNACMLLARENDLTFAQQQALIDEELSHRESQAAGARYAAWEAWKVISERPFLYVGMHMATVPVNLLPAGGELLQTYGVEIGRSGTLGVARDAGVMAAVKYYFEGKWGWLAVLLPVIVLLAVIYGFALVGMLHGLRIRYLRAGVIFLGLLTVYFMLAPGGASHPRFRMPAMPLLAILAAHIKAPHSEW